jgi:glycosyltransferase involved in cell wall biosynthesis
VEQFFAQISNNAKQWLLYYQVDAFHRMRAAIQRGLDLHEIARLVERARNSPSLSHVYAFEIDRRIHGICGKPVTFSFHGLAEECSEKGLPPELAELFKQELKAEYENAIYKSEILASKGQRSEALAHAFMNAQGMQIHALNLFYANYATKHPLLRLYYLNKYLDAYDLSIELVLNDGLPFIHRLRSKPPANKVDGPLVTVIMPARNAERTIELTVGSLLNQSWQNLQIIVVDDASTDSTLEKIKDLAKRDRRVEVLHSPVNVGPYVCRNLGLLRTRGQWLTTHDSDDWAFPGRIEQQVKALTAANALAGTGCMLRMNEQGQITRPIAADSASEDGYLRLCFVSLMVQTNYFRNELGAWDSVRVGGDHEMIERIKVLGTSIKHLRYPLMLCLDNKAGLTNHQVFGLPELTGRTQPLLREDYKQGFIAWHKSSSCKKIAVLDQNRPFKAPTANIVDPNVIKNVFANLAENLEAASTEEQIDEGNYSDQQIVGKPNNRNSTQDKDLVNHIIKANLAIDKNDETGWLKHVNAYLNQFKVAPIYLDPCEGQLFDRFKTSAKASVKHGPLITVIMAAWNAEKTIYNAVKSI